MAFKSKTTKEIEEKLKKGKAMKSTTSSKKTIVYTVLVTLTVLGVIGALLFAGFTLGRNYESSFNHEVNSKVQAALATKAVSKQ